jgi:hypothetical protein
VVGAIVYLIVRRGRSDRTGTGGPAADVASD